MSEKLKNILLSILPVAVTGIICSYITRNGVSGWYSQMNTSVATPPNYIFSVAWSIIYVCLMISFYRVLSSPDTDKACAVRLFWHQLILQILWCGLFFGMQMPLIGGLVILWLIWVVFKMIRAFGRLDKVAGILNYFYFLYICFAAYLNWSFLYANNLIKTF